MFGNKKLLVLHIIDSISPGGVNSFVYDLCLSQRNINLDSRIIVILKNENDGGESNIPPEIPFYFLNAKGKKQAVLFRIPALRKLIKSLSKGRTTICNLHLKLSVLVGVLSTICMKNIYRVETYHSSYHHYKFQYTLMKKFIAKYIAVSDDCKAEMRRRFHTKDDRLISIPNGVSRNELREIVSKNVGDLNRSFNSKKTIHLLSVGRLSYQKNLQVSAKALSNICNEKLDYKIIGEGEYRNVIEESFCSNNYIFLLGNLPRESIMDYLFKSDLLIMPSLWEGRSILQLEAMAFDLPMVISDVASLREPFNEPPLNENEIWRKTRFGYLVQTNNIAAYQESVLNFVTSTTDLEIFEMRKYISQISRENDITVVAGKYKDVYLSLLSKE